jgi:flagellar biosynthesis/type III secretory pathway protein FliH
MSNNKESSVEWLIIQLIKKDLLMIYGKSLEDNDLIEIIKQAKAMRKEELDESYQEGYQDGHETAMSYIKTKEK